MVQFKVGQKYRNMKGVYEVVTIKGNSMRIRWENGEEITSTLDLQQRIIERMEHELELKEAAKRPKPSGSRPASASYGKGFKGLDESDFKGNVAGTNWRSREKLGGAVTRRLSAEGMEFNSWPVYRLPVIHWCDMRHHERAEPRFLAKFIAQLDEERIRFGFCVERSDQAGDPIEDWTAFMTWLREPDSEVWLLDACFENGLIITDVEGTVPGTIRPDDDGWRLGDDEEGKGELLESLAEYLDALPAEGWVHLQILKSLEKEDALDLEISLAEEIATLFGKLMPLYIASAVIPDKDKGKDKEKGKEKEKDKAE